MFCARSRRNCFLLGILKRTKESSPFRRQIGFYTRVQVSLGKKHQGCICESPPWLPLRKSPVVWLALVSSFLWGCGVETLGILLTTITDTEGNVTSVMDGTLFGSELQGYQSTM